MLNKKIYKKQNVKTRKLSGTRKILLVAFAAIAMQNVYAQSWSLTGNPGTVTGINFIGTTDNIGLSIKTNNTQRMVIDAGGNIGIGTIASATTKLSINGDLDLSAGSAIKIGGFDILALNANAVCLGSGAGVVNTGSGNTFLGFFAGNTNVGGVQNTFMGNQAGNSNISGNQNTFLGNNAGFNSNGDLNTFVGEQSGSSVTSGDANVLIGKSAGFGLTTGSGNVLVGQHINAGSTRNNGIVIGNNASLLLDNCAVIGNSSITKIGIGKTPSASSILEFQATTAKLTTGGVWTNASDRKLKDNISQLDKKMILEKIDQLEVARWHYKADENAVTHIGPFAKEFYAAFQTGDDTTISTIDPGGVALIGIQQLSLENKELHSQIDDLKNEMSEIKRLLKEKSPGSSVPSESQDKKETGMLYNAVPNPAGSSTTIQYQISKSFRQAEILVTDNSGTVHLPLKLNTASGEVTVNVSSFRQGYYQYSLMVDGVNIDTKHFSVVK